MSDSPDSRDDIGRLIKSSGRGPYASPEARARVYSAANAAWRGSVEQPRARLRLLPWLAAAASIAAIVAVALFLNLEQAAAPESAATLARFDRIDGRVELVSAGEEAILSPDSADVPIKLGDLVRTGPGDRAAIEFDTGLVLRVDEQSAVRFASPELLALERGALYLDTGADGVMADLEVQTFIGHIRHLGTQYEVSVEGRAVRVRVREGEVIFQDDARAVTAAAGEQVSIPETGPPIRSVLAPDDAAWDWAEGLAVLRNGDDASVSDLLAWVARETGSTLRYADTATEAEAGRSTLHGIEGLTPAEVLDVIEGTTSMRYVERDGGLLVSTAP